MQQVQLFINCQPCQRYLQLVPFVLINGLDARNHQVAARLQLACSQQHKASVTVYNNTVRTQVDYDRRVQYINSKQYVCIISSRRISSDTSSQAKCTYRFTCDTSVWWMPCRQMPERHLYRHAHEGWWAKYSFATLATHHAPKSTQVCRHCHISTSYY